MYFRIETLSGGSYRFHWAPSYLGMAAREFLSSNQLATTVLISNCNLDSRTEYLMSLLSASDLFRVENLKSFHSTFISERIFQLDRWSVRKCISSDRSRGPSSKGLKPFSINFLAGRLSVAPLEATLRVECVMNYLFN